MVAAVETMAYVGAVPWHGLGKQVDENISLEEFQKQAGLDWQVKKTPVLFNAEDGLGGIGMRAFKDRFVLKRTTDNHPFAVVSGRYKPVQPKEIFSFFTDLLSMYGMKMHTAGSLMDGGRIWCLAKTGDAHKVRGTDRVDGYLLLSTSYDLTLSTLAQFTSVRVVCNNTLQQALSDSTGRVTIPHMQDFEPDEIKDKLGISHERWVAFTQMMDALAKTKLDLAMAKKVINTVFQIPDPAANIEKWLADSDRVHADNVIQLFDSERFIGADLTRIDNGQSAWGLLNCVTEYTDFHKRARSQGNRLNNAWFGEGANLKQRAVNELTLLAA